LFLWIYFGFRRIFFSENPPEPARRAGSPARSVRLVSGQAGKVEAEAGTPARAFSRRCEKKKSELFA
jgi:hypothetical protein